MVWVLAGLLGTVLLGVLYQALGRRQDARRYPPPGRYVTVGGRRLHLVDQGEGQPTVVLEAGIAASSVSWRPIQEVLARETRVCSYDRAGLGWSDSPSAPLTAEEMARELRRLLTAAEVPGPYVLVGHSYGGLLARLFAIQFPEDVAGLVLVDPVPLRDWAPLTPAQQARLERGIRLSRRGAWLTHLGLVRLGTALAMSGLRSVPTMIARVSGSGKGASVTQRLAREVGKLPPDLWPVVRAHWCHPKSFQSMANHLSALPASAAVTLAAGALPDVPVIVLTASHASDAVRDEHRTLGEQWIASRSGHWIQLDEPELVLQAVRDVLAKVRGQSVRNGPFAWDDRPRAR